ncbi:four helix bundle protein [bacterium]|nr:four helix bundle protein [bacterium]
MKVQDLDVWKAAIDLAAEAYKLAETFPETTSQGLGYHLRASVTHLPANIAAAASRKYGAESLKYLFRAKGIIYEVESMYYLAEKLNYIDNDQLEKHVESLDSAKRLLFGFIKYYKKSS